MHRRRLKKYGEVGPAGPSRRRNGIWGRPQRESFIDTHGYRRVYAPDSPARNAKGYVLEHRLVMVRMIGRELLPGENYWVHPLPAWTRCRGRAGRSCRHLPP
jgi:hypothetical protein